MKLPSWLKTASTVFLGAAMVALSFAPYNQNYLAWVAFIPLLLAIKQSNSRLNPFIFWLGGFGLWLFSADWFANIAVAALLTASAIMGLKWVLLYFLTKYLYLKKIPFSFSFAVVIVGLEAVQGIVFGGFDWNFLAHSQYKFLHIIQIADITGTYGISLLIAMVNGCFADLIIYICKIKRDRLNIPISSIVHFLAVEITVIIVMLSAIGYGIYRLNYEDLQVGPLVGVVQPDIPSVAKGQQVTFEQMLERLIAQTELCYEKSGAEVIAWPETMIPVPVNQEYVSCCNTQSAPKNVQEQLVELTKDRFSLIAGAPSATLKVELGQIVVDKEYNSAMFFEKGLLHNKRYDKIHLVPFGEYIPLGDVKFVQDLIMHFNKEGYDFTIDRGEELLWFSPKIDGRELNIAPSICYEDTDAELTRRIVFLGGSAKADLLLNISNDGWYVKSDGEGSLKAGKEHYQRMAISVFRAVENRVSLIRSVNTGVSCMINPLGEIVAGYQSGNLPENAFDRGSIEGWFADNIIECPRTTFFSQHGLWLAKILRAIIGGVFIIMIIETILNKLNCKKRDSND